MSGAWNPRYLAYCAAHGFAGAPELMIAADRARFPGAHMGEFMRWNGARWREWMAQRPASFVPDGAAIGALEQDAYTHWLSGRFGANSPKSLDSSDAPLADRGDA